MTISLEGISKRFNREWIFKHISYTVNSNTSLAITGANGSGKSTLLQIISGNLLPSNGKVSYLETGKSVDPDKMYQHISFCAPYLDIIDEFSLEEFLSFHFKFKTLEDGVSKKDMPSLLQLEHARSKKIKDFSTGMRQRVKLGICFFSNTPIVLLDEPTTNLDKKGINWYQENIGKIAQKKTIIVSSNSESEYSFCEEILAIEDYK